MKSRLWYRSRGLRKMESRVGSGIVRNFIKERLNTEKEIRVLEIGFGEGKCLLDLRVLFPQKNVKLFGINKKKDGKMHEKIDFIKNAKSFGLKIVRDNLPKPYFYDAGDELKFKDNFFDLVISQVSFHYVGDKAKL
ncbi:MAG: class I SAM-dependent methyltransferase, partial [Nanoarchaeota archaeon]